MLMQVRCVEPHLVNLSFDLLRLMWKDILTYIRRVRQMASTTIP